MKKEYNYLIGYMTEDDPDYASQKEIKVIGSSDDNAIITAKNYIENRLERSFCNRLTKEKILVQ